VKPNLPRRLAAEFLGTLFLVAAVVGSGIMADRLAGGNVALALLANTIALRSTFEHRTFWSTLSQMTSLRHSFAVLACVALLAGAAAFAQTKTSIAPIFITHVTVINPGSSSVQSDMTVIIDGDRITSVSNSGATLQRERKARRVDGRGQFLIPGLWDMHVHSAFGDWFPGGREIILPLFIANGVTGVRDMGGDIPVLFAWRKEITEGKIIGPRMIVSGPMLDALLPDGKLRFPSSIAVTTPESAMAAVDSLKGQGVDFIKVQSVISHDAYLAAATEAHKVSLPIVGHVPDKVRIRETIDAAQKSIEHLMGSFEGCSTEEEKFIAGQGDLKLLLATQDKEKCDELIRLLAQTQTWQVPTLAWQRGGTFLDQRDLQHEPLDKYVPAYWRDVTWKRFTEEMMPGLLHDPLELRREYFARNLQMVGAQHRAGVLFLAGTDTAPGVYIMPGFSLHDELANFVEAGFTPMESLQTATSNPAKFLGMENRYGSVEAGKIADLVLLTANPLEDIHNTKKITAVIANGRLLNRAALDGLLKQVEFAAKHTQASPQGAPK
jgi:imidazolonepropionase-like amidohydrolase